MTMDFLAAAAGDIVPPFSMSISALQVRDYLDATGEDSERWTGLVPPLAVAALVLAALTERMPLPIGVVHSGQELEFIEPVPVDADITGFASVERRGERKGVIMTVLSFELRCEERVAVRGRITIVLPTASEAPVAGDR